jgi:hypothetical protein
MPSQFGGILDDELPKSQFGGVLDGEDFAPKESISPVVDTAKSVGSNLVGGAIDTAMVLPNLINQVAAGPQLLGRGIADTISPVLGVEPQPRGELWKPFYDSSDAEKFLGTDYQAETTEGKVAALPARLAGGIFAAKKIDAQRGNVESLLKSDSGVKPQNAQAPTPSDIKVMAQQQYAVRDADGAILQPNVSDKFLKSTDSISSQTDIGRELSGDSIFTDTVNRLKKTLNGKPITLKDADEVDDFLSDRISETFITNPAQSQKIQELKRLFRDSINPENLSDADIVGGKVGLNSWREGDKLWQAQSKLREIDKIVTRANMTENPATAMKTGFRNLYMNAKKTRGYSAEEMKLLEKAAQSGAASEILGALGSRLGQIISLGSGGGIGQTATLAATSMAARGGKSALQAARANKLSSVIAEKAVPKQSTPIPQNANQIGKYAPVMSPAAVGNLSAMSPEEVMRLFYGFNPQ